jgi:hypothetical protein
MVTALTNDIDRILTFLSCASRAGRYRDNGNAFPECSIFDESPGQGAVPKPKATGASMQSKLQRLAMKGLMKTAVSGGDPKCKQQ